MRVGRLVATYRQGRAFFTDTLWETRLACLTPRKALLYRWLRVAAVVVDGLFFGETLPLRAAALTYYTVLSLVPLLAFVFAILKGFGAYDALVEEALRPYLVGATSTNPALRRAVEQVLDFVSGTGVASLGFLGLVLVLYASTRLLRNVEAALNGIWAVPDARPFATQLQNYTTILVVTPLCLLVGAGLATTARVNDGLAFLRERLGLGDAVDWALRLFGPLGVILIGLLLLNVLMPNTRVRVRSALAGAIVGSALWYVFLLLHVQFQLGVARYNALYSSFAAFPIFLVWTYLSWLSVLVGAQTAAAHQQGEARARRHRWEDLDHASKEALALSIVLYIAEPFAKGQPPRITRSGLSDELGAPPFVIHSLVDALAKADILNRPGDDPDQPLSLARSPAHVRVLDLIWALRGRLTDERGARLAPASEALQALQRLEEVMSASEDNRTVIELLDAG